MGLLVAFSESPPISSVVQANGRLVVRRRHHRPEHCYEFTHNAFWVHFIGLAQDQPGRFGSWPKAEVEEESPYWKTFYGKIEPSVSEEEVVMETQTEVIESTLKTVAEADNSLALVLVQPNCSL